MRFTSFHTALSASVALACVISTSIGDAAVNWRSNLDAAKIEAAQSNRFLLLHFWSPACGPCKTLDQTVFSHPPIGGAIEQNFVPVKINTDVWPAITEAFRVTQVPTEIILSPQGVVLAKPRTPTTPNEYILQLNGLAAHFRRPDQALSANPPQVNQAYATLPISSVGQTNAGAAGGNQRDSAVTPAGAPSTPQSPSVSPNANPYATTSPNTTVAPQANAGVQATGDRYSTANIPNAAQPTATAAGSSPVNQNPYFNQDATPATPVANYAAQNATSPATQQMAAGTSAAPTTTTPYEQSLTGAVVATTPAQSPASATVDQASASVAGPATPTPAGTPSVGMEGYCPVTVQTARKWLKGSPTVQIEHRGRVYHFVSEVERDQFRANPDRYSPVFNGLDPVLLIEQRQAVEGTRRFGYEYRGAVYLFSSKETMEKFGASTASADYYSGLVYEAMRRLDSSGDTARR